MGETATVMDIRRILEILPHRYPFLLVDRILEVEEGKRVVGIKNVTFNEPFFQGHFPGNPIMPGVLIVEAMAQVGAVLLLRGVPDRQSKLVYFAGIDRAKFRRPVTPGDQIRFEVEVLKVRSRSARLRGEAFVDGLLVAEAELFSSMVERDPSPCLPRSTRRRRSIPPPSSGRERPSARTPSSGRRCRSVPAASSDRTWSSADPRPSGRATVSTRSPASGWTRRISSTPASGPAWRSATRMSSGRG